MDRTNGIQLAGLSLVLLVLASWAFAPGLEGGLIFDDKPFIEQNEALRRGKPAGEIFKSNPARFLTIYSFKLDMDGRTPDPDSFRRTNWTFHLMAGLAVLFLAWTLLSDSYCRNETLRKHRLGIAFTTTAIFLLHPLQTASVHYPWQRATILAGLTYFLSMALFAWSHQQWHKERTRSALIGFLAAWLVGYAAMFTKESAATLFIAMALMTLLLGRHLRPLPLNLWVAFAGLLLVVPITYLDNQTLYKTMLESEGATVFTPWEYWRTQAPVTLHYVRLLLVPFGMNLDHHVTLVQSWSDWRWLVGATLLLGMAVGAWMLRQKRPYVAFAIGLFFVVLSVEALAFPLTDVMFDHRAYPAVLCFALAVSALLFRLPMGNNARWVTVGVYIVLLAGVTQFRSSVWADPVLLWQDAAQKSPNKLRPQVNLAIALRDANQTSEAIDAFDRALAIAPNDGRVLEMRGLLHQQNQAFQKALDDYNAAIAAGNETATLRHNRGAVYLELDKPALAIENFDKALKLRPGYGSALFNKGLALEELLRYAEALAAFFKVTEGHEKYVAAQEKMGAIAMKVKDAKTARRAYENVLRYQPKHLAANLNLGILLSSMGEKQEAIDHYTRMIGLYPNDPRPYMNRGTLNLEQSNNEAALADFSKVMEIQPNKEALLRRAATHAMLGNKAEARADLALYQRQGGQVPPQLLQMVQ